MKSFGKEGVFFLKKSVEFFGGLKCFLYVCIWKGGLSGGAVMWEVKFFEMLS